MKFLGCFFLFFSLGLSAQKSTPIELALQTLQKMKEDTLKVNHLNKISGFYTESDSAKAIFYSKGARLLSQKLKWGLGEAKSNFSLGTTYSSHFNYDRAIAYYKQSLKNADEPLTSKVFQGLGGVYIYESKFSEALDCYFRALKIDERYKDQKGIAKISANIGSIYYGMHHYNKAVYYFNKAAITYQKLNNASDLAIVYRNIGSVYNSMSQMQKAIPYFEKSFDLSKKINDTGLQARILSDLALTFYNLEQYNKAISYSMFSLKTKNFQDKQVIAFNHGVMGDSYIELAAGKNDPALLDSAGIHLNAAITLHKELKSSRDLAYDYSSLTRALKLKGDYKKALESYEIAMVYEDSVFNFDNKETIKNLEDKRAIELRDREIKINKLKLEIKEKQKWILVTGMILLLIVGGMLWQKNIHRKKVNQKLKKLNDDLAQKNTELDQANKIKAFFFSILNHDLRSPVYQLIHFLELKNEHPELLDDQQQKIIEQKTRASAEHLVASMEDMLLWSKSQMEQFEPQPEWVSAATLLNEIKQSFSGYEPIKFSFENLEQISLYTDVNYLKTILRNLTANAVKVLEKTNHPSIVWKVFRESNKVVFSITDNGPGAEKTQFKALYDDSEVIGIKSGLGLHVIRDLAKAIQAEVKVETNLNQGTTISIWI